jgi:dTDP-4-dehydrorhamnose reductase
MNTTKAVLIIGGSGFIGTHLCLRLREHYKVFATYHTRRIEIPGVTMIPMNVSNRNWVKRVLFTTRPEVILYVAGSGDIRRAEADPHEAELVNTTGASTVSNTADLIQSRFIYLSNPFVFDGSKGNYHETDVVLPSTALGKCKVGMENFLKGKSLNQVIVRSSPVYGRGNGRKLTFMDSLRIRLDNKQRIELPTTEYHSFVPITGLIDFLVRIVESGIRHKILHYGGLTKVTPYDFGTAFAKRFGYDPQYVLPLARQTQERSHIVETAGNDFSLNSSFVAQNLKVQPLLLEEGFDLFEKSLNFGRLSSKHPSIKST